MDDVPGGADVGGVGGGAGPAGLVTGQQEEVVQVDITGLLEGVVPFGRNAGGVALCPTHHLESGGRREECWHDNGRQETLQEAGWSTDEPVNKCTFKICC